MQNAKYNWQFLLPYCLHSSDHMLQEIVKQRSRFAIDWTLYEWITGKQNREYEERDSKTHHLDVVQRLYNTGDEDADDDVADADDTTAALRFSRSLIYIILL